VQNFEQDAGLVSGLTAFCHAPNQLHQTQDKQDYRGKFASQEEQVKGLRDHVESLSPVKECKPDTNMFPVMLKFR
jgi:hypothetical protein